MPLQEPSNTASQCKIDGWNLKKSSSSTGVTAALIFFCVLFAGSKPAKAGPPAAGDAPQRPIRLNVPMVLVYVSAMDSNGRAIPGLRKDDFALYEDGEPQRVSQFSSEDVPMSIGLVFDNSGSMRNKMDVSRAAVQEFLRTANLEDEFSLISFNNRPSHVQSFGEDPSKLLSDLYSLQPGGLTSLLDAVYMGLAEMRHARYSRKALIIFSDGGDNHSSYSEKDIKRVAQESDTQIYAVDIHGPIVKNPTKPGMPLREELLGPELLEDLVGMNGGHHFMVEDLNDLPAIASKISHEMRNVYVLGYTPSDEKQDGKWHKIRVRLVSHAPRSVELYAKSGYYAPQQ